MLQIAITGGIACGKSLFGSLLAKEGFPVLEADEVARTAMTPSGTAFRSVVASLGGDILDSGGYIDRGMLATMAFKDPVILEKLNNAVHPHVKRRINEWLNKKSKIADLRAAFVIVPLLFEAEMGSGWDAIICVACSENTQRKRLGKRDNSIEYADKRIAAQMPVKEKARRADFVIINNGNKVTLKTQTKLILKCILEK